MYDEQVRANKAKDKQSQGQTDLGDELCQWTGHRVLLYT